MPATIRLDAKIVKLDATPDRRVGEVDQREKITAKDQAVPSAAPSLAPPAVRGTADRASFFLVIRRRRFSAAYVGAVHEAVDERSQERIHREAVAAVGEVGRAHRHARIEALKLRVRAETACTALRRGKRAR